MLAPECKLTVLRGPITLFNRHFALCMTPRQMQSRLAGRSRLYTARLRKSVAGVRSVAVYDGFFALVLCFAMKNVSLSGYRDEIKS